MRSKLVTETYVDDFRLGYWSEEDERWYALEDTDKEKFSKMLKCSPELVSFLETAFADLTEELKRDLADIWNKQTRE